MGNKEGRFCVADKAFVCMGIWCSSRSQGEVSWKTAACGNDNACKWWLSRQHNVQHVGRLWVGLSLAECISYATCPFLLEPRQTYGFSRRQWSGGRPQGWPRCCRWEWLFSSWQECDCHRNLLKADAVQLFHTVFSIIIGSLTSINNL